jgi:hypothetical protein
MEKSRIRDKHPGSATLITRRLSLLRENVGRVDSLGRYCPGWEEAPDTTKVGEE